MDLDSEKGMDVEFERDWGTWREELGENLISTKKGVDMSIPVQLDGDKS